MAMVITRYMAEQLAAAASAAAGFDPLSFNPNFYARFGLNAYQDLGQATPAVAYPQRVEQLRDGREIVGGNLWPYLQYLPSPGAPYIQPDLSDQGGALMEANAMALHSLTGIAADNFTAIWTGAPAFDYVASFGGGSLFQIGDTFSSGFYLGYNNWATDGRMCVFTYYNTTPVNHTTLPLGLAWDTVMVQSTPAGVTITLANGASALLTAVSSATIQNGYLGEDARLIGNFSFSAPSEFAFWSPALSDPDAATVYSGFTARGVVKSIYPKTWNLVVTPGDSLTLGVEVCPVAVSDTWPYQFMASLGQPAGRVIPAHSGLRVDQITAAYQAGILQLLTATGRPSMCFVSVLAGTNDLANGDTTSTIIARLTALCQPFVNAGAHVNVCTIYANNGLTSGQNTERGTLNTALRALFPTSTAHTNVYLAAGGTSWAHTLTDLAAVANLSNASNVTYFNDGTHNTALGYGQDALYIGGAAAQAGVV